MMRLLKKGVAFGKNTRRNSITIFRRFAPTFAANKPKRARNCFVIDEKTIEDETDKKESDLLKAA